MKQFTSAASSLFVLLVLGCLRVPVRAQSPPRSLNPAVKEIVESISQVRIADTLRKLEAFGTRNTLSETGGPHRGTAAARRWIYEQFSAYSPRLQVRYDTYHVKKKGRLFRDADIVNIVAVLPGVLHPERQFLVAGHYDSLNLVRKPPETESANSPDLGDIDAEKSAAKPNAPGVTDDASGTAAVLELARVMSQSEFENTIVFVAFDAEEQGLIGSTLYAAKAKREKQIIEGVLNNDIIGSDVAGNGSSSNRTVRVFSEEPNDSASRELGRYIKEIGERYLPAMKVDLIFRQDRFARGGDHSSFNAEGFPAVRLTTPSEHYANQHTATDTFANTSPAYATLVTKINAAALATLALAPRPPSTTREVKTGTYKGRIVPNISRGKSQYDARLRWTDEKPDPDLAGYAVTMRATTAPYWEREIYVGNATEFLMENVSIDEATFGVKAIDKDGNESLVTPYVAAPYPRLTYDTF